MDSEKGSKTTTTIVVNENSNKNKIITAIENENIGQNTKESTTHKQFFKITQQFGIEAGLLPVEKQMPIEDRSVRRERLRVLRTQANIEAIMEKTYHYCANNIIDQRTDLDWFNSYISLAENVSNRTMQDLWAKILSGELSRPGSYSLKALKVFRDMSIVDAKLLAKACSLAISDRSKKNIRLISGSYQQPGLLNFFNKGRQQHINLSQFALNYTDLLSLADNHLIFTQENESNLMKSGDSVDFIYNGQPLKLTSSKANVSLQFYKFTAIGAELASLITDKVNDEFFMHLKQQLSQHFIVN